MVTVLGIDKGRSLRLWQAKNGSLRLYRKSLRSGAGTLVQIRGSRTGVIAFGGFFALIDGVAVPPIELFVLGEPERLWRGIRMALRLIRLARRIMVVVVGDGLASDFAVGGSTGTS